MKAVSGRSPLTRTRYDQEAGFTLIEVLVTLSILAALSLAMVGMVSQIRSIQSAQKANEATVEVEALAGALAEMLGNSRSLPLMRDNPQRRFLFRGTARSLEFVGVVRVGAMAFGLRDIVLSNDETASRLVSELHARRAEGMVAPETVVLSEQANVRFLYFAPTETGIFAPEEWRDEWSTPGTLPYAVRLEVSISRDGRSISSTRLVEMPAAR